METAGGRCCFGLSLVHGMYLCGINIIYVCIFIVYTNKYIVSMHIFMHC